MLLFLEHTARILETHDLTQRRQGGGQSHVDGSVVGHARP